MRIVLCAASLLLFAVGVAVFVLAPRQKAATADRGDTVFLKLRFEHSDDLVEELGGFKLHDTCRIRCNDGKVRTVRVGLLDRGLQRVGIVLVNSTVVVGGDLGGRGYDPRGTAFVELEWMQLRKEGQP